MKTSVKVLAFALALFLYTGINAQTTNPYPGTSPSTDPSLNDTTNRMNRTNPTRQDKTRMYDTTKYQKKSNKNMDTTMTRPSYEKQEKSKATENDTLK